jgi:hypothetical protein
MLYAAICALTGEPEGLPGILYLTARQTGKLTRLIPNP